MAPPRAGACFCLSKAREDGYSEGGGADIGSQRLRAELQALKFSELKRRAKASGAAVGEVEAWHPKEPHWYLFSIGTDPARQGEGLGSRLMDQVLPGCDADGRLAYLESSSPQNVPFYQRHGFEVTRVIQIGTSPTFTLMTREPR